MRFLFAATLGRRDLARSLVVTRNPRKLPDVLSVEEAAQLLEAAPGIKYKAALGVAYGAGLRVSEVAHLKVDDIDSTRMLNRGLHRLICGESGFAQLVGEATDAQKRTHLRADRLDIGRNIGRRKADMPTLVV